MDFFLAAFLAGFFFLAGIETSFWSLFGASVATCSLSLQGIHLGYLDLLEEKKTELIRRVKNDELVSLYWEHFGDAEILHKEQAVRKNLGSFFAKFVHTFNPEQYCALDNPIRKLLGLKNESFFQSFLVISAAYRIWISQNPVSMAQVRSAVPASAQNKADRMTDLKLLDLVFWYRANVEK